MGRNGVPLRDVSAKAEAASFVVALKKGSLAADDIRELIAIEPAEERLIRDAARDDPAGTTILLHALQYRAAVLSEFERLVNRAGLSIGQKAETAVGAVAPAAIQAGQAAARIPPGQVAVLPLSALVGDKQGK
jgi:hypothetical protein